MWLTNLVIPFVSVKLYFCCVQPLASNSLCTHAEERTTIVSSPEHPSAKEGLASTFIFLSYDSFLFFIYSRTFLSFFSISQPFLGIISMIFSSDSKLKQLSLALHARAEAIRSARTSFRRKISKFRSISD